MPKHKLILILGYSGVGLLCLLALAMIFPITQRNSFALCTPDSSTVECTTMPLSTEVGITTSTVISLATSNKVQMEVIPKSTGTTSYAETKLSISTNSNDGYALYLQAGSSTGNLTGVTSNLDGEITNTMKTNVTLDNLETNSYGYALSSTAVDSNTTYSHIPTTNTIIKATTSSLETVGDYSYGDTYYLAFGTKIGTNLPSGQYAGTVTVSAVANPTTLRSMYDLTYMQEMTTDICENTKEHYTKQLIDTRDGKSYWVAKLKDGNCWMVQNLALDLDVNSEGNAVAVSEGGNKVELNNSNTDIDSVWNSETGIAPLKMNSCNLDGTSKGANDFACSWNIGRDVVLATPEYGKSCFSVTSTSNMAEVCEDSGLIKITEEWNPTFVATNGNYALPDGTVYHGIVAVDVDSKTYDAHYLFGNYYQGSTVRAGQPKELSGIVNVDSSLCPAGWDMPTAKAGSFENNIKGSFAYLFKTYGLATSDTTGVLSNSSYNIVGNPLYFVRAGHADGYHGYFHYIGNSIVLYGGTVEGASFTFGVNVRGNVDSAEGNVINSLYRSYNNIGQSIRCIAK